MKEFGAFLLIALFLSVAGIFAVGYAGENAAKQERARGNAESAILRAQSQARIDRAEARAIELVARAEAEAMQISTEARAEAVRSAAFTAKMLSALPYAVLAVLGVLGLAVVSLAGAILSRARTATPRIIERQIVYLPPPGQSRRDTWQIISEPQKLIEGKVRK